MRLSENNLKFNTENLLKELTIIDGISSDEKNIADKLIPYLNSICDTVDKDTHGNLIGYINTKKDNAKTIIFEAHMDRIGLVVTKICADGRLNFTNIGGVDERILVLSEVTVLGKKHINGIIIPEDSNDTSNNYKIENLKIETGLTEEEVKTSVKVGDLILINSEYTKLCNNVVSGGGFDNRAGIVSILKAVNQIDRNNLKYNIIILFTVQEELGLYGAYLAGKNIDADAAIVVDVTHGETNDTKGFTGVFPLGCGAVICRGPNLHYTYTKQLIDASEKNNIPYRIEVASGSSGTNAWALQTSSNGIPSMLISIPLRYMHTNVETLKIDDINAIADLLTVAAEGGVDI